MESSVFTYFFAIGSGLTAGIAFVGLPAIWLLNKIKIKGDRKHVRNLTAKQQ